MRKPGISCESGDSRIRVTRCHRADFANDARGGALDMLLDWWSPHGAKCEPQTLRDSIAQVPRMNLSPPLRLGLE